MKRLVTSQLSKLELRRELCRPEVDEVTVDERIAQRNVQLFGAPLTPGEVVERIVHDVAKDGDAALLHYTRLVDGVDLTPQGLFVSEAELDQAQDEADPQVVEAICVAAEQIRRFHEAQVRQSFFMQSSGGSILGQRILPLDRVGCYVPGGRAPLVSSALMSIIPAVVAGVKEIVAATPCGKDGRVNPHILTACRVAGAHRILKVGGAQAIAALAYGTETVPKVDKIVGPGNVFVTLAKKLVFGRVGIDSLAGPSEIMIVADGSADPALVAADMLSQAEHDPEAAAILATPDEEFLNAVLAQLEEQVSLLDREETARESLRRWGKVVLCRDLAEAVDLINLVAPEHVELLVAEPWRWLPQVRHGGAVFLGTHSTESIGDYVAGPNHILPTNGTARFASPLGVDDFVRRSSVIAFTQEGLAQLGETAVRLAEVEGLGAHAEAVRKRLRQSKREEL
ncbi:MAG TPA: histidinol dehydrogenase [Firmicutes bacterium]|jgi:histidinol dehydrogenase|nr:histidinol dehydrogenase [Bacillota bacterium]